MPMSRAEAAARVVAAAKKVVALIDARPETDDLWSYGVTLRAACGDYDACPPEATGYAMGIDVAAGMIATEADVQEARALAWAAGEMMCRERDAQEHGVPTGYEGIGWWPTRDAEHAAWAGTYWIDTQRGGGPAARHAQDRGAMTPAPSGPEVVAGGEYGGPPWRVELSRVENDAFHRAKGLDDRLSRLETAVMGHECAGPAELIDSARLDALAAQVGVIDERLSVEEANALNDGIADRMRLTALEAQVGRVERAVRAMATRTARDMLDGGPDA